MAAAGFLSLNGSILTLNGAWIGIHLTGISTSDDAQPGGWLPKKRPWTAEDERLRREQWQARKDRDREDERQFEEAYRKATGQTDSGTAEPARPLKGKTLTVKRPDAGPAIASGISAVAAETMARLDEAAEIMARQMEEDDQITAILLMVA